MDASQFLTWLKAFEHHARSRGAAPNLMVELFFSSIDSSIVRLMQATTSFYDTWCIGNNARDDWIKLHEFLIGQFRTDYMGLLTLDSFHNVMNKFDLIAEKLGSFNMIYLDDVHYLTSKEHQSLKCNGWTCVNMLPEPFQELLKRKIQAETSKIFFRAIKRV